MPPPPPIPTTAPPVASDRPSTAPSSQPFHVSRARAEPKKARTTRRQGPPYKLPPKIWTTSSATSAAAGELNSPLSPPALPFAASERAASISSASSRGFVDLLDAQWAIKPSDFRTRVQAAGARDYGEDVADRNMHAKGFDLRSPKDQEVYLRNTGTLPAGVANDRGAGQSQLLNKRHSMGNGLRTTSLNSNSFGMQLLKSSIQVSEQRWTSDQSSATSATDRTNRRNSLHSYVATTSSMLSAHEPLGRGKPQVLDFSSSPAMLREKLKRFSELDLDDTTMEKLLGRPPLSLKTNKRDPAQQSDAQSLSSARRHRRNVSEQSTTSREEYPETIKRAAKRQTMHYVPNASATAKPSSKRRGSLQNFESYGHQDRMHSSHKLVAYHEETPAPESTKVSIESKALPRYHEDPSDPERRTRARSIASVSSKDIRPQDIEEIVPERNSSLRNYSLSSETATYSSLGSSSVRPHSRHTPTTSIDLTPTVPFFNFTNSPQRAPPAPPTAVTTSANNGSAWKGQHPPQSPVRSSPAKSTKSARDRENEEPAPAPAAPILTIDEYADEYGYECESSSEVDSFDHSWRPRGENEKDLLFVEGGYGLNGSSELPGLPGLLPDMVGSGPGSRPGTSYSSAAAAQHRRLSAFYDPASDGSTDPNDDDDANSIAVGVSGEEAPGKVTISSFRPGPPLNRGRLSEPARPRWPLRGVSGGAHSAAFASSRRGRAVAVHDESSDDEEEDEEDREEEEDVCFDIPRSRPVTARYSSSRPPTASSVAATVHPPPIREEYELPIAELMRQRKAAKAKMRGSVGMGMGMGMGIDGAGIGGGPGRPLSVVVTSPPPSSAVIAAVHPSTTLTTAAAVARKTAVTAPVSHTIATTAIAADNATAGTTRADEP